MSAQVTSFENLKKYAEGTIVQFPPFAQGQPFIAKVKRPSLLSLMAKEKIPNALRVKANELFIGGGSSLDADDENMSKDLYELLEIFAESSLIEPSYTEIKDAGLELTDEQLMFIFNYTQQGIKQLEPFRQERISIESDSDVEDVQQETK